MRLGLNFLAIVTQTEKFITSKNLKASNNTESKIPAVTKIAITADPNNKICIALSIKFLALYEDEIVLYA